MVSGFRVFKVSWNQGCKGCHFSKNQSFKISKKQGLRILGIMVSGFQVFEISRNKGFKISGCQSFEVTGILGFEVSGFQGIKVFRNFWGFKFSWKQDSENSTNQVFKKSNF
jgi:uncharacterized protein YxjI